MLKNILLVLMSLLMIPLCQAGVGFDNYQCLNCPGEIKVPIGYVLFDGRSGWQSFLVIGIMFCFMPLLMKKRLNNKMAFKAFNWMMLGIISIFFLLSASLYFLDKYLDLSAKKEIVGNYMVNNENLNIYLENSEVYESKTKEKFILGPYRDYLNTSSYHILRKDNQLYLVNFKNKTVYLLQRNG